MLDGVKLGSKQALIDMCPPTLVCPARSATSSAAIPTIWVREAPLWHQSQPICPRLFLGDTKAEQPHGWGSGDCCYAAGFRYVTRLTSAYSPVNIFWQPRRYFM
jgi:hypothetical protein